jgi:hypothetical protein
MSRSQDEDSQDEERVRRFRALTEESKIKVLTLAHGLADKDPYTLDLVGKYRAGGISADELATSL